MMLNFYDQSDQVKTMTKTRKDNYVTSCTYRSTSKKKLSYHDRSNWVRSVTKVRQESDVINRIYLVYAETKIELSRPILLGTLCDENQIGQWCDWWNRCGLRQKMKLSFHDRSDRVPSVIIIREDNDVTNRTWAVYIENKTELSW